VTCSHHKLVLTGSTEDSGWYNHGTQEWNLPEDSQEGLMSDRT